MHKQLFLTLTIIFFLMGIGFSVKGQETTLEKRKSGFGIIPALAYTPETGFTFGILGDYYFDFAKGDVNARMSKYRLIAIYTTKKQLVLEFENELFTKGEDYYINWKIKYANNVDRDYGMGNDAGNIVRQYYTKDDEVTNDLYNFIDYEYRFFSFKPLVLKRIKKGLFVGLQYQYEKIWDYNTLADSLIIQDISLFPEFSTERIEGGRSGLGAIVAYDTRKNVNNPLEGVYLQFRHASYLKFLGSDFRYTALSLDARKYFNVKDNHTFAVRLLSRQRYTHSKGLELPIFDLARLGGKDQARGYFEGTYQDAQMLSIQAEYRMPLWLDYDSKIWQFWKRLGIVGFVSSSRVYPDWENFSFNDMRYTVGGGIRFLINSEQKLNIRIDYGIGLDPNSGLDKRQSGLYFFIGESF